MQWCRVVGCIGVGLEGCIGEGLGVCACACVELVQGRLQMEQFVFRITVVLYIR